MITLLCDGGCGTTIPSHPRDARHDDLCRGCRAGHEGSVRGSLDPLVYCADCAAAWDEYSGAERAARIRAVTEFEAWVREARQPLRTRLARLPDDFA